MPLLVIKESSKNSNCTSTKMSNGNGLQLIDNSEHQTLQSQISPVTLSSSTQSHVIKSRLNQYNTSGSIPNSVVVRLSDENGTEISTTTIDGCGKSSRSRKKNFAEI